jgi:hypothetical protein
MSDKNVAFAPYSLVFLFALVVFGTAGAAITDKPPAPTVAAISQIEPEAVSATQVSPY